MALVDRVAQRLKLRDLRLLDTVVRWGSMAKASDQLHLSQPAVSKAIAEMEHLLGVRLLERGRQGIKPTAQGRVLLRHGIAIFDELRQGVAEIEFLSDPTVGEVRISVSEPIAAGLLPYLIDRFSRRYPQVAIYATQSPIGSLQLFTPQYRDLRDRNVDLILGPIVTRSLEDDLAPEALFDDPSVVAVGVKNKWARRRTIGLADLMDESWVLQPFNTRAGASHIEAFRASSLDLPRNTVISGSVQTQIGLLGTQRYVTIFPQSLLRFSGKRLLIKGLPIKLPVEPFTIGIVTLKRRNASPATQLFIKLMREVTKLLAKPQR